MKKFILTLGILLAGIIGLQAQNAQGGEDKQAVTMINKLTQVCKLTQDQISKVTPIIKQFVATRDANREKFANDPDGLKEANRTNQQSFHSQLSTILTEDQMAMLKEYQREQKGQTTPDKPVGRE